MPNTQKQQPPQQQEQPYNDHPIITYSNRIQKHLLELTRELSYKDTIERTEKRKLKLIIANLPPQAKQQLKQITTTLESKQVLDTTTFDQYYSQVSNWIYTNILQDAFKVKPLNNEKPHIGSTNEENP